MAFPPKRPAITIGQVIADAGKAQLHVAETEKYPHVTYFFNGGEEHPYAGEVRELAPSPRDVPTYDHKPEMSAREATEAFLAHWREQDFAFAIINFANADMVGHTGVIEAAVRRSRPWTSAWVAWSRPCTARAAPASSPPTTATRTRCSRRTARPTRRIRSIPCRSSSPRVRRRRDGEGILADVAPTALALLGIEQPEQMTGRSLLG